MEFIPLVPVEAIEQNSEISRVIDGNARNKFRSVDDKVLLLARLQTVLLSNVLVNVDRARFKDERLACLNCLTILVDVERISRLETALAVSIELCPSVLNTGLGGAAVAPRVHEAIRHVEMLAAQALLDLGGDHRKY